VPPNNEDNSRIDELKESLYSRTAPDVRTRRKLRYTDEETNIQSDWKHEETESVPPVELNKKYENHSMSFFTKLLIVSIIFCVGAVGIGAYIFFNGANLISADNIEIKISGPVSIPGGEPVTFDVITINKNNVDLQLVDMKVDFPVGSVDPDNPSQTLQSYRKLIGDIKAGGNARESIKAIIFGEENNQKQISVTLTYGVKGSNSVFTKIQTYDVIINSSPINVTVSSFTELTSGQEFDMKVTLKSNSEETLKNVILKAEYPFGYTFISSSVVSLSDKSTWKIGDILPGKERSVTIHGKLTGEDSDLRVFRFAVGAGSTKTQGVIGTQYMTIEQDITIEKPFISLKIDINNDQTSKDYISKYDQAERVNITWFNNLPDSISNVEIVAKISGSAYSKSSISPDSGYFNSSNDEIVWNQKTNSALASIGAGESGNVSFTITPRDQSTNMKSIINPTITVVATVSGRRSQEANVPQVVNSAVTRNINISSNAKLSGRVVRTIGSFVNTGFIPPKVDAPTTYTIIWDVDNTSSTIGNASVKATLPQYVKWLNNISPSTEDITYDKDSGTVTWNIGNVETFTLNSSRRKEVAFQVSLIPSVNQIGQSLNLVNRAVLTAIDNFTGVSLQSEQDDLTTRFSTDPAYRQGDEMVMK
jgi:hypothetical protein